MSRAPALVLLAMCAACGARSELDVPDGDATRGGADGGESDGGPATHVAARCTATRLTELAEVHFDASKDATEFSDQIALFDGYVYFHTETAIRRVPKSGGALETLTGAVGLAWPWISVFAVGPDGLTFLTEDTQGTHLERVPLSGGAPVVIGPPLPFEPFQGASVSRSASGYYVWGEVQTPIDGLLIVDPNGNPTSPMTILPSVTNVLDQGSSPAYITGGSGVLLYTNPQQRIVTTFLPVTPVYYAADGGDALFGIGAPRTSTTVDSVIYRMDKATNAVTPLLDYGVETSGIAVDAESVYFCDRFHGTVMKTSRAGGTPKLVGPSTSSHAQCLDVAVDDECVYWTVLDGVDRAVTPRVFAAPK